ncbi:EamA family transporter [Paenibacillus lutrae]|uniref:EamA family transporter n=1 Tax=Paenibacillus lutrae TaxID=2078573 RepID=A0A7X3FE14_9BACL|nr:DMT family transporter [Paenibacillus lutrae]MVO98018.1 EamA family transporter [Paenibacillus lutrae]
MWKAILLVFLGSCSYGMLSTIVKFAYEAGFEPGEVVGAQNLFGTLISLALVLLISRKKMSPRQWIALLLVGLTTGFTGIFYYNSLQTVPASIAIVLLFQFTWMGVILEAVLNRKRPSREKAISIVLLLLGTVLASGIAGVGTLDLPVMGVVLGLLSAVTYTGFIYFSGKVSTEVPALNRTFLMNLGGFILVSIYHTPSFLWNGALGEGLWKYALLVGILGVVVPTLCFNYGIPKLGTGLGAIIGAAELPVAVIMSAVLLHEGVSALQWAGVLVILFGIAYPHLRRKPGTITGK